MICPGFKAASIAAGIKKNGDTDLGLLYSEVPATAVAVFTTNKVKAAPVILDMERIKSGKAQAVIVNSGNANCFTGKQGMLDAKTMTAATAKETGISPSMVLVASTGVIGAALPIDLITKAMPPLVQTLSPHGISDFASAIMTTDTVPKIMSIKTKIKGQEFTITGIAKGSGMIRPDMATMLGFIISDIDADSPQLQKALHTSVDLSFNRITIDGDTSTNDTVLLLANGLSGVQLKDESDLKIFQKSLDTVTLELAKMIVRDGEGASKLVEIIVQGAANEQDALQIAFTIADSKLVQTALFGEDANWGRILAAAGRAGAALDPQKVDLYFNQICIVKNGQPCPSLEKKATEVLQQNEFCIILDLKLGSACFNAFTCDLSLDYIRINADYRS